jgi:rhamnose utilization protein RhaD (predicted bifunctional aldolase and dehydrogenase)
MTASSEFDALRSLSARIGSDPWLTQAAGGNTSIKDGDILWIKASGTWLAHATERDIMVPVSMPPLLGAVADDQPEAEQAHLFTVADLNRSGLRPSIETTVHALLPQRVVIHVHCVDTIALAVRADPLPIFDALLAGLNWVYVPYCRPGLPLAKGIARHSGQRPDVLVLGNHGLVVAAETVDATEALLESVKARIAHRPRRAPVPSTDELSALAGDAYRLPAVPETHAVACDRVSCQIAESGSLYPDHVIFLGAGAVVAKGNEDAAGVSLRLGHQPAAILFPDRGVLMRKDASPAADAMARCLADVTARIPDGTPLRYLTVDENAALLNWDAEKYRQKLDAAAGSAQ